MRQALEETTYTKQDILIPGLLFILFLAFTLPGIAWGAPALWHPDEIVYISIRSLHTDIDFDSSNFNHPHLPIYVMLGLGKLLLGLGQSNTEVLIAARVLSAILLGSTIVLTYFITRRMGLNAYVSGLGGLLLLSVSEMTHNGHFAHNDTFVTFFSTLTIYLLFIYKTKNQRGWLYATSFSAGLALSSKYSALSLSMLPIVTYLWSARRSYKKRALRVLEIFFIGGGLVYLGFSLGTPKALLWMAYFFKGLIPALQHNSNWGAQPDSLRGLLGQFAVLAAGLGPLLFLLFGLGFLWAGYRIFMAWKNQALQSEEARALIVLALLVIDLPIMISYNYPIRFFLPLMPLLSILGALLVNDLYAYAKQGQITRRQNWITASLALVVMFSLARVIAVMLLFLNDSRIAASSYVATLPVGSSLEHTLYPPTIPSGRFGREHNYPLFFRNSPDQTPPTSTKYEFNAGEAGLDDRLTDYLVVDSFTSDKFKDSYTCAAMPVECAFFAQLATGESTHYKLVAQFTYFPPSFLPQLQVGFVNPEIRVYERIR